MARQTRAEREADESGAKARDEEHSDAVDAVPEPVPETVPEPKPDDDARAHTYVIVRGDLPKGARREFLSFRRTWVLDADTALKFARKADATHVLGRRFEKGHKHSVASLKEL